MAHYFPEFVEVDDSFWGRNLANRSHRGTKPLLCLSTSIKCAQMSDSLSASLSPSLPAWYAGFDTRSSCLFVDKLTSASTTRRVAQKKLTRQVQRPKDPSNNLITLIFFILALIGFM